MADRINLKVDPELHKEAYIAAIKSGKSLSQYVRDALKHMMEKHAKDKQLKGEAYRRMMDEVRSSKS